MDTQIKRSIIVYFDILGYKEKIAQYGDELYLLTIESVIQDVLGELKFLSFEWDLGKCDIDEEGEFTRRYHKVNYRIFSDNFVLAVELFEEPNKDFCLIRTIIPYMVRIQQQLLILHKTFIRGSVVIGNICFNDNYVFGSGLINAYMLENDIALFPRIILDDESICIFKGYEVDDYVKERGKVTDEQVIDDIDGNSFINYLPIDYRYIEEFGSDYITKAAVSEHKFVIIKALENTKNKKVLQKYYWCKNFHNRICEKYGFSECIINEENY